MKKNQHYIKLASLFIIAFLSIFYSPIKFNSSTPETMLVEVVLTSPSGKTVSVMSELATNEEERSHGLMYRRNLNADEGMLFLWNDSNIRSFWMKNTYIPLDMIFINDTRIVGFVENAKPHTITPRTVGKISNAVLEVNAGFVKKYNIQMDWKIGYSVADVVVE